MMNISTWVDALKIMGAQQSKKALYIAIRETCLYSKRKPFGTYLVNNQLVWERLILTNPRCTAYAHEHNLNDPLDVESMMFAIYEHKGYLMGKSTYRKFHQRK